MNNNKLLVLNLPAAEQITRRYMCSYVSPESLMPPLELISCAAIARSWHKMDTQLIDAIAQKKTLTETINDIRIFKPKFIVTLSGFECFDEDMDTLKAIKNEFPEIVVVLFGHYATHFAESTLKQSNVDFIILGEPEMVLHDLLSGIQKQDTTEVNGIAYIKDTKLLIQGASGRIKDPNQLPPPAYDLLPVGSFYYEPLLARPYGMIQTMRGCPYQCNYCVKSYGSKLSQLSVDRIIDEMKTWKMLHGVKSIRFIDDTFTINKRRTIELCKAIIDNQMDVEWACLSRTDNLDEELLTWMKKSGCKRIYFGMESGSQRMLNIYKKNVNTAEALQSLLLCRKVGIETAAFFMAGHPEETESDFLETLAFAKAAQLSFASFNPLTPYPGTALFEEVKELIHFNIYPYTNEWKDKSVYVKFDKDKLRFYKGFYLRPSFFLGNIKSFINNFGQLCRFGIDMLRYLFWDKQFVISGLKGANDK